VISDSRTSVSASLAKHASRQYITATLTALSRSVVAPDACWAVLRIQIERLELDLNKKDLS
jgi:uncharacterized small protein (DUF1192 family)